MTELTAGQLNRATLARQLLLGRERLSVAEAVRRVVALQAQEPASPYLALWARVQDFEPVDLDRAFREQAVVKSTLLRVTLHAVHRDDHPVFHSAMQPTLRAARLHDGRFRRTGLTPADADRLLPEALAFADRARTNAEAEAWVDERLGELPKPGVWWAFRQYGPFLHAVTGGAWSFGQRPSYVAAPWSRDAHDVDASMASLAFRYLEGFGPATARDIASFALVTAPRVRAALEALGDAIVTHQGPAGVRLYDVVDGPLPDAATPAPPRLLPMWDSVLLAYVDRSRLVPEAYRKLVARVNGDVLPTLLVDGHVAGVWRPTDDGIEATAFEPLTRLTWSRLREEAVALRALLADRDAAIYRRYAHWWSKLPSGEVRLLR